MDESKALVGLEERDNYQYPLADVSHLSEKEKYELRIKGMRIPKELKSDEEFEQWVTVYALWEAEDPFVYTFKGKIRLKEDEIKRFIMDTASYERAMWYYKKRFNTWDKEALQPLVDELVSVQHHRQADGQNRFATM